MGAGMGMLIAYFIDANTATWVVTANGDKYQQENTAIYFSLIAIGGGLGMMLSYFIEKKHWVDLAKKEEL
jgi:hypothetical protein